MAAVCGCFLNDAEIFLGCGREGSWPVVVGSAKFGPSWGNIFLGLIIFPYLSRK
jgi:hypothetical protein